MKFPVLAVMLAVSTSAALAAEPARVVPEPPRGVAGRIVSVGEESVILLQKDGSKMTVPMTRGWTLSRPREASVAELRLGDFIASASKDAGPDKGVANELRVMEAGYRPEYGTHSIAQPQTSMTHGFVFGIVKGESGTELEIAYPSGRRAILVPEGKAITVFDLLPRGAAVRGVAVEGVTRPGTDGIRRASRLTLPRQSGRP